MRLPSFLLFLYGDVGFDVGGGGVCGTVSLSRGSNAVIVVDQEVAFLLLLLLLLLLMMITMLNVYCC